MSVTDEAEAQETSSQQAQRDAGEAEQSAAGAVSEPFTTEVLDRIVDEAKTLSGNEVVILPSSGTFGDPAPAEVLPTMGRIVIFHHPEQGPVPAIVQVSDGSGGLQLGVFGDMYEVRRARREQWEWPARG